MIDIQRWYERNPKLKEMMHVLSNMPDKELDEVATYLYRIVNIYAKEKRQTEEVISIGLDKLSGYYKAYNKRRWYDKNAALSGAINTMSTLGDRDITEIVDGFIFALKEVGLYDMYLLRKQKVQTKENI